MTFPLNKWALAAAIAVTSTAHATTVVARVGDSISLTDGPTSRTVNVSLNSAASTLFLSNGTTDPSAPPPARLDIVREGVAALNVTRTVVDGVEGAQVTQTNLRVGMLNSNIRAIINIGAPLSDLALDNDTGAFSAIQIAGGATLTTPFNLDVADGGTVTIKNLRVDLKQGVVLADITGRPLISLDAPVKVYGEESLAWGGMPLWTIGSLSGPTSLPIHELLQAIDGDASLLTQRGFEPVSSEVRTLGGESRVRYTVRFSQVLSDLKMTDWGLELLASNLGLTEGNVGRTTFESVNNTPAGWGTLKLDMTASFVDTSLRVPSPITELPEPETYVLMGIGLLGLAGAVRCRRVSGVTRAPE